MVPITWVGLGEDGTVELTLSSDGGATFPTVIDLAAPNSGTYTWDTTVEADGPYRQICVTRGGSSAKSRGFTIDNASPVTVVNTPNGGGLLGPMITVTWTTTDLVPGTVEILASADSGANYDVPIEASAPDTGSFTFDASALDQLATYRIQVTPTDAAGNTGIPDASDADFGIDHTAPLATLVSPNGGEVLSGTTSITWTTVDENPGTVDILLSTDGGSTYAETLIAGLADVGAYSWRTGETADSAALRILVRPTDLSGKVGPDEVSDLNFTATNLRLRGTAEYRDVNNDSAMSAGDELLLRFDKEIAVQAPMDADFVFPVAGDRFGTGATFGAGPGLDTLLITLGASPTLTTRGLHEGTETSAGASSGLELAEPISADAIEDAITGVDAAPIRPLDVFPMPVAELALPASSSTPRRGDVGDIDQDGDLDVVLAVEGGNPSEVWMGDGSHGWALAQSFDGDDTQDVALGDVDGDGDLDVVTATAAANRVWLNNGSGVFLDSGQAIGAANTRCVLLADFDRDGDLDAFFGNTTEDSFWTNDGSGTLTDSSQSIGSGHTAGLDFGDLDGDGDLDVLAAHSSSPSQAWLNDGGVFSAGAVLAQVDARDAALGDFNGDRFPDVFIAASGQNVVYLNDGAGGFASPAQTLGSSDHSAVALLDLDGDGDLDAVTSSGLDGGSLWVNDGDGVFAEGASGIAPGPCVDVLAGRFDVDADTDLFMVKDLGAHLPYRSSASGGQAQAAFTVESLGLAPQLSGFGESGDVNGDGLSDLIVPDRIGASHVLLGNGDGGFTAGMSFGPVGATGGDLFDADGDGDLDYLQRVGMPGLDADALWLNAGNGDFTDSGLTLGVDTFVTGDLDGDGDPDLVVVTASALETWDGDGSGSFAPSGQQLNGALGLDIFVTDMDGDGDPDVLATSSTSLIALRNDGSGSFSVGSTGSFSGTTGTIMADLDRDGDDDILFASATGGTDLRLVRNSGSFGFVAPVVALANQTAFEQLELHDVNEDGYLDLLAVDRLGGSLFVAHGNGDGTFQPGSDLPLTNLASITLVDVDRDGDMDAYASKGTGAPVSDELLRFE